VRKVGRYQLATRLASGTLGDVFLAQAEPAEGGEPSAPRFAVKVIKPNLALDPRIARLVLIEGQTAIHFSHPVAVRVHEAERDGADLYVSTDLVGGQPLSSVLKKLRVESAPLDHRLICHVGAEVASALAKAHELPWFSGGPGKFVHATLSPKRILLGYEGETQLLGLGWARARLTQPLGMATLPFASPEVAAGREPSPRSDVYSLATILYYAFSGRPIFRREDEESTRAAIKDANAPPLNSATLTVDPSIGDLLAEMMAPRIEARPDSMSMIEAKLRAAAAMSPEEASGAIAKLMQTSFAEDAEAFRRLTKAATRAAPEPKPIRKLPPREESRLAEVPKSPWEEESSANVTLKSEVAQDDETSAEDAQVTEPDRPSPLRARIARYVIERPISRSSSASVYACRDPNVSRVLMVKVVDPERITDPRLSRSEWIRLFKNEARIAGRLRHEGFPLLYDAGRDEGSYFIAFEALAGETLKARQDRGERFTSAQVRRIAVDLARALHHMHGLGLVHCDVRASNVLLSSDGHAKLVDFSLASYVEGPQHPLIPSNLTTASPEVLSGDPYAPMSEQFALGNLIYQLLVGTRPFRGLEDPDLVHAIRTSTPRPPESIDPNVEPSLSEICMRLLEKDPAARFESMSALADQLEESLPERKTVLEQDTEPMIPRPAIGLDAGDLADTVIRICERVSTLSAPDFVHRSISDAPAMARSLARRLALGEEAETRAALAVAIRDLADRARLSLQSEEMTPLIPRGLAPLVLAVDRIDDGEAELLPQLVSAVESYYRATRPRDGRPRKSPRRAVLELKAQVGTRYPNELVEALVEHLREVVSALDLTPAQPDAPRILVAGVPSDALLHALEFDGFAIEAADDGHAAWEKLRKDSFSGAIVDASLPGRDALSLLKLCRAHPDTARIAFLILGHDGPAADLEGVATLERSAALENIRAEVGRLLRK
jgi:serine/threonine protein kinase/CheY-like chemotaxis protein